MRDNLHKIKSVCYNIVSEMSWVNIRYIINIKVGFCVIIAL
nr:MAG TPA: hypothetical protein [Caudoviricetes sp.]